MAHLQLDISRLILYGFWTASPPFLAWSSDGKWLLALEQSGPEAPSRAATTLIVRISVDAGEKSPFPLSLDTDQSRRNERTAFLLSGKEGLAVSADGKRLAFIHRTESPNGEVYWVPLTDEMLPAGPATSLHFETSFAGGIAWDADGRSLIVSSNRRGSPELWRVPVERSEEASRINLNDEFPTDLAVSRTGHRLAYTHSFYDSNIWRVDLTNGRLKNAEASITSTRAEFHPSYSADGKRIAFESNRFGNEEIWVRMRMDRVRSNLPRSGTRGQVVQAGRPTGK